MKRAFTPGRPWQSRLIPYEKEILEWRRRRPPMPFVQIVTQLANDHGIKVHLDTVHNFVKVRLGLYRDQLRTRVSERPAPKKSVPPSSPANSSEWDSLSGESRVLVPQPKERKA